MERLQSKAEQLGIRLSEKQLEQFQCYYERLIEKNKVMNLTAITEYEEVVDKHFIDSILLGSVKELSGKKRVIDVGTGAGFPGIPLKIVYPELEITLLDSLNKRVKFLDEVIEELGLTGIQAVHSRAEDLAQDAAHRQQYDICVSRAVANLSTLSEYCIPFVKQGGYFISYKSTQIEEELKQAKKAVQVLGGTLEQVETVQIPGTTIERQFVMIRKTGTTPKKFPRKAGTASKTPIE